MFISFISHHWTVQQNIFWKKNLKQHTEKYYNLLPVATTLLSWLVLTIHLFSFFHKIYVFECRRPILHLKFSRFFFLYSGKFFINQPVDQSKYEWNESECWVNKSTERNTTYPFKINYHKVEKKTRILRVFVRIKLKCGAKQQPKTTEKKICLYVQ